jgi:tight adherence protein C
MPVFLILLLWSAALLGAAWMIAEVLRRQRSADRIKRIAVPEPELIGAPARQSWLAHWFEIAGIRWGGALAMYVAANIAAIAFGVLAVVTMLSSRAFSTSIKWLAETPGGIGDVVSPFLYAGPWIICAAIVLTPTLYVRSRRRTRVRQIEQDLPMALELFATLAESGLSFDAALARILEAQPAVRPLTQELRMFQLELMAGTGRVACLRRFARRIALSSTSSFVSALVQAEQVGAAFADVLRRQADDLRSRRSERATVLAQGLPVKLVFPLILCFLPMIFVSTLGPAFHQFFQLASNVTRNLR